MNIPFQFSTRFPFSLLQQYLLYSGLALAACFFPQRAGAVAGDLYVADFSSDRILKFTPSGVESVFASGLGGPKGLAFDSKGNLFVADLFIGVNTSVGTVYKFTPDGLRSVFASGLGQPVGLAFDSSDNLFVADVRAIYKFTPDGTKTTFASGDLSPFALAFDISGDLFVADSGYNRVLKFTPHGDQSIFASDFLGFYGLAFDRSGNLFVSSGDSIVKFALDGTRSTFVDRLDNPFGLAFDTAGNLFEADDNTGKIFKFTAGGVKTTFASGLHHPWLIAFEPNTEKLRNISTRGLVQTGENVLIAGLIVGGNSLATNAVVLRAIGPSLVDSGISNPLQDPILELHNSSGALITSNDNWQDTQKAQLTASGLAPTDPNESAIYATLAAGRYTAVVRGANDSTGVALVEVYNLSQ